MAAVVIQDSFEIPLGISSLADFRRWSRSDAFPEQGRIDYLFGRVEVDMSPEDLFVHGTLKGEIHARIHELVRKQRLGYVFVDSTRVVCPAADLSVEPDIVFLSYRRRREGRVTLVPKAGSQAGRYVEIDGPPDLVVEVVSDTSVRKDTERLPKAYFEAGAGEFWLVDARSEQLRFEISIPGEAAFEPVPVDEDGYQRSSVLPGRFRLQRARDEFGDWEFELGVEP